MRTPVVLASVRSLVRSLRARFRPCASEAKREKRDARSADAEEIDAALTILRLRFAIGVVNSLLCDVRVIHRHSHFFSFKLKFLFFN